MNMHCFVMPLQTARVAQTGKIDIPTLSKTQLLSVHVNQLRYL